MVAALGVERFHRRDGLVQHPPLRRVFRDPIGIQRMSRIIPRLDCFRDCEHDLIEPVGLLHQRKRKIEMAIILVVDLDPHPVRREHILPRGAELEGVAEVDRGDGLDWEAGVAGLFERGSGGEGPGGAGEVDGDGVDVDSLDHLGQLVERSSRAPAGFAGGVQELFDGGVDEGAGAAGGVEHALLQRLADQLVDDGAGEPERRVVLAQALAILGRDHGFVEDSGDVGVRVAPIEMCDAAGHALQPALAADLGRPAEEVGFDHAAHAGFVLEDAPLDQIGRLGLGLGHDVDPEGALHGEADHDREVGVLEEERIEVGLLLDGDAERGREQAPPEFALDADRLVLAVGVVERAQLADVLVEARAGAEPPAHLLVAGRDVALLERLRDLRKPAVELEPAVG